MRWSAKNRAGLRKYSRSERTPWYSGPHLLDYLETVDVEDDRAGKPFRMPVQWVNRPNLDFRGFSGFISGGNVEPQAFTEYLTSRDSPN